ncbi:MAG: isochorismate synthase [Propionicimonas sp.]|uniref:isochorismate synthase n=1 Tax=Propionicimonas sp. TaxID=1955623 RepID=UPI003D118C64
MIHHPPGPQWRATTVAITDPGDLASYLPPSGGYAWLRRGDGMVGIGEVARFEGGSAAEADEWWQEVCARIEHQTELPGTPGTGPVAFASFVFDAGHTSARSVVVVPRIVVGRRKGLAWLTSIGGTRSEEPGMPATWAEPSAPVGVTAVDASLDAEAWQSIVKDAVGRIGRGALDKVVLARAATLAAAEPLDPRALVCRLADRYPTCWTYRVDGLVGASPEMLIRTEGGLATSRVLAGTIRRNGGEELDLKLAHALARSGKNLAEHELAVDSVAHALEPYCSGMNVPDAPYVLELPNVLHLASDVTAVVHPGVSVLRLAGELHPSAAVCGTPTDVARATIAELEHLDRGRYSGPVGWLDSTGDGEFAIALRCGLIDPEYPRRITLYAGCGIVAESDPAEEFAETEAKLLPMLEALGVDVGGH